MSSRNETDPELKQKPARVDRSAPEAEAPIVELPSRPSQVEVKVESPISYFNVQQEVVEATIVGPPSMRSQVECPISSANAQQCEERKLRMYKAAVKGDWKDAERVLESDKNAGCLKLAERGDRPLHIAAVTKQTAFVRKLVERLNKEDLILTNKYNDTAFCFAAISGVVEIAKLMYEKNSILPTIREKNKLSPIEMAALSGKEKMVKYLYKITPLEDFEAEERMDILVATINREMYDIALKILEADRYLVIKTPEPKKGSALHALARKPLSHYGFKRIYGSIIPKRRKASQLAEKLCEQILTLEGSKISNLFDQTSILTDAAKIGNVELLTLLIRSYPDLIWTVDKDFYSIFHVAVIYRQEEVFNLIYSTGAIKDLLMLRKDKFGNNVLQLAAKLPPSSRLNSVSGAALQMQRELQWFKEVEKILRSPPQSSNVREGENFHETVAPRDGATILSLCATSSGGPPYTLEVCGPPVEVAPRHWIVQEGKNDEKNRKCKTPRELFTEEHEGLREAGERWMKGTATSCMVVTTLIATVALNASFTLPDGNKVAHNRWFTVFATSNAVAMFSSTASIMTFLSILTSRYGEDDFLYILPVKLMVGLFTLFASIVCMVLKFSATYFLVHEEEKPGISPKIVAGLALLPITLYVTLNFRLWYSVFRSTIRPSTFMFRPGEHGLF
ncbi:uncharacterized protein LOC111407290 isoform X2 [Olea europaea var. sylvestris]|nr:uncharacterized protein LOC111407290 isoform X2 [Olea europaea var. sylvestris]XP_022892459.1 uncharacterized protein LOC111407290 isoform X2 [Olea europaea var. sylvestris]